MEIKNNIYNYLDDELTPKKGESWFKNDNIQSLMEILNLYKEKNIYDAFRTSAALKNKKNLYGGSILKRRNTKRNKKK